MIIVSPRFIQLSNHLAELRTKSDFIADEPRCRPPCYLAVVTSALSTCSDQMLSTRTDMLSARIDLQLSAQDTSVV